MRWTKAGPILTWKAPKAKKWGDVVNKYAIYRFAKHEKVDINDVTKLQKITYEDSFRLPYDKSQSYTYVVTALDRVGNESKIQKIKVKM